MKTIFNITSVDMSTIFYSIFNCAKRVNMKFIFFMHDDMNMFYLFNTLIFDMKYCICKTSGAKILA